MEKFCTLEIRDFTVLKMIVAVIIAVTTFIFCVPVLVEITKWWFNIVQGWF